VPVDNNDAPDLVWGAIAIARVIGRSERSTFHMLERNLLPAKRVGGRWCASRRKLLAALIGGDEAGNPQADQRRAERDGGRAL
jgi:hypothetical protein